MSVSADVHADHTTVARQPFCPSVDTLNGT